MLLYAKVYYQTVYYFLNGLFLLIQLRGTPGFPPKVSYNTTLTDMENCS